MQYCLSVSKLIFIPVNACVELFASSLSHYDKQVRVLYNWAPCKGTTRINMTTKCVADDQNLYSSFLFWHKRSPYQQPLISRYYLSSYYKQHLAGHCLAMSKPFSRTKGSKLLPSSTGLQWNWLTLEFTLVKLDRIPTGRHNVGSLPSFIWTTLLFETCSLNVLAKTMFKMR